MKINGQVITKPEDEVVVIPRRSGDLVFKARAVDFSDFMKLCPAPQAPTMIVKGGGKSLNVEDKEYKKALSVWATQRTNWMIIKSLQATEGFEWETVKMDEPSTWGNFQQELEDSGLTALEINAVVQIVLDACGLNQKKIDEATKRFLAGQAQTPSEQ
jgi:hypothetical protein